jgi:SAM-dependent methyltransferase
MDYPEYLRLEEARMMRETQFYYHKYLESFEGASPLLDIGCGTGNFMSLVPESNAVYGLDVMPENVARCQQQGLSAAVGSITDLPFADGSMAGIFSAHVLEHLWRDELLKAADEIERVLEPGGKAIILVPRPKDIWDFFSDPTHVSPMTEKRLTMLFNRFSSVEFVNYYIPGLKGVLTVRNKWYRLYDVCLKCIPFRGHTSITAVCVK